MATHEITLVGERVVAVFEKADGPGDFDPLVVVTEKSVYELGVNLLRVAGCINGRYVDSLPVILKGEQIMEVRVDEGGLAIEFGSGWIAQYYLVYDGERVWPRLAFFTPDEVKEWYGEYSEMLVMLTNKN